MKVEANVSTYTFATLKLAVARQFEAMKIHTLYRADVSKDALWETYLSSFPEGMNPLYRERTEHDCQCCKHFIRAVGAAVAIVDGVVVSIWDCNAGEYQPVVDALSALVHGSSIDNLYLHTEAVVGTEKNFEAVVGATPKAWEHFHLRLPTAVVAKGTDIGPKLSEARGTHDVLLRSLTELTPDAIDTVLELIAQNSLYRGEEQKFAVDSFRSLKWAFDRNETTSDLFVWDNVQRAPQSVSRIRNTAIGTLLVDLSEGKDMDAAVASFEAKVAPANYKRPTALVTKAMIAKAKATVEELGLTSALERRYATIDDVPVTEALFVDRARQTLVRDDPFTALAGAVAEKPKNFDRVEEVSIAKFLSDVLPKARELEVLFENRHAGNLVSLTAPVDPGAGRLFKWPNGFAWSYAGDVADSLKERVKKAGGSVTGDLCCRLAWDYTDDLDFHMQEPAGGGHIYYANVRRLSSSGGMLDLDANGCDGMKAEPVENIFYADKRRMREGVYRLYVHNYSRRSTGSGFEVEVEFDGETYAMAWDKVVRTGDTVEVAQIQYSHKAGFKILDSLPTSRTSKTVWGLPTQTFQKVKLLTVSPNHWLNDSDRVRTEKFGGVGNKHWFFILEGCVNAGTARGFYNEFLDARLEPHRKTLEMVGAKMRTDETDRQLSGLGFSSTVRNSLTVRVTGASVRVLKVVF